MNDDGDIFLEYTYSLAQIAEEAEIGETTVRKYINDRYSDIFPSHTPKGARHPKYPAIAVEIVKRIYDLSTNENKKAYEIIPLIESEFADDLGRYRNVIDVDDMETAQQGARLPHAAHTPQTAHLAHTSALTDFNAQLAESMRFSLELARRHLKDRDEELKELVQMAAELEGEKETLSNELVEKDHQIEELQEQVKQLEKDLEEEKKKYGFGGLWKRNE